MTVTTSETLSVDGVVLNTLAKNIETLTGRLRTPPLRGSNLSIPSRHGALHTATKVYDENEIVLPMWVAGCDDDGEIPYFGSAREEFFKNLDALSNLFRIRRRLLDVRWTKADGSIRQAMCEVQEAIDFSVSGTNPVGKFSVVLRVPDSFWQDIDTVSSTQPVQVVDGLVALPEFAGATAPMEDLVYTITGPISNPRVYSTENGEDVDPSISFQYDGVLLEGESLTVDCSTWELEGAGGLVVDYANFTHLGHARFMVLEPEETPAVRVIGTGLGANTSITVTGRRKFLLG